MSDNVKAIIGFLVFSAILFLIGGLLGVYDYNVDDEAHINMEYRPPAGDRRY